MIFVLYITFWTPAGKVLRIQVFFRLFGYILTSIYDICTVHYFLDPRRESPPISRLLSFVRSFISDMIFSNSSQIISFIFNEEFWGSLMEKSDAGRFMILDFLIFEFSTFDFLISSL